MASVNINNRRDVLLLLLYSPGISGQFNEPITGRTRLTKLLFLFKTEALEHFRKGTEITDENFYQFFPWRFGPFSSQVYDDLTFFILRDFIATTISNEESLPESAEEWARWQEEAEGQFQGDVSVYQEETFILTPKGVKFAEELYASLSSAQKDLLKSFKLRVANAPLRALLKYVYKTYPKMTDESEIAGDILGTDN